MEILHIDYTSPNASKELYQSFLNTGFAIFRNYPIDHDVIEGVLQEWKAFFDKSETVKNKLPCSRYSQTGYFPFLSENAKDNAVYNLMEFYHWRTPEALPEGIGENTRKLQAQSFAMAQTILAWVEENLPEEIRNSYQGSLPEMIEGKAISLMRFIHYPALKGNENPLATRASEHEDLGVLTIIPAATQEGLQVKDIDGNWHAVTTSRDEIVVNAGDMLQELTQYVIKSTTHRVVNPPASANVERLSTPCFFSTRPEIYLKKDLTAGQFYRKRMEENGLLAADEPFFVDQILAA